MGPHPYPPRHVLGRVEDGDYECDTDGWWGEVEACRSGVVIGEMRKADYFSVVCLAFLSRLFSLALSPCSLASLGPAALSPHSASPRSPRRLVRAAPPRPPHAHVPPRLYPMRHLRPPHGRTLARPTVRRARDDAGQGDGVTVEWGDCFWVEYR